MSRLIAILWIALSLYASNAAADPPSLLRRALVTRAVQAAVARAGLDPRDARALVSRARASAWLPSVSARYVQGLDALDALNYQSLSRTSDTSTMALDVRVTLDLSHTVFHPSEVGLARMEMRRVETRRVIQREVIDLLASLAQLADEPASAIERARVQAQLEQLTGLSLDELRATP